MIRNAIKCSFRRFGLIEAFGAFEDGSIIAVIIMTHRLEYTVL